MRGRSEYDGLTREGNEEAIRLFSEAIAEDSSFALAWAGLADGYFQRVQMFGYPAEWADSGGVAAERALEIDPELPEGYKSFGNALGLKGRATEALDMYVRAFELNPNLNAAVNNIGYSHFVFGEQDEALRWIKRAFTLSPNLVLYRSNVANEYMWLGEYDIARAWLDRARALWPRNWNVEFAQWQLDVDESGPVEANRRLVVTYGDDLDAPQILAALAAGAMLSGDAETALAYAEAASAAAPDGGAPVAFYDSRIVRAWALSRDGLTSEALEILNAIGAERDRLVEQGAETARLYYLAGQVHALRGSNEEAVNSLVNAFEAGYTYYNWFDLDPTISAVRDDPRLVDLRHAAESEIARQRAEIEAEERAAGERD
ncbi:MAG: tetratricopeptide repeat protein [Gemmatimonadota bacterium]